MKDDDELEAWMAGLSQESLEMVYGIANEVCGLINLAEKQESGGVYFSSESVSNRKVFNLMMSKLLSWQNSWIFPKDVVELPVYLSPSDIEKIEYLKEQLFRKLGLGEKVELGKLTIAPRNRNVIYVSRTGARFSKTLGGHSNSFKLLSFMAKSPGKIYTVDELVKEINKPRELAEYASRDVRIRNTLKAIKDKLGLKGSVRDELFLVERGHFGLGCRVEVLPDE